MTVRVRRGPAPGVLLNGSDATRRVVLAVVSALDTRRARVVVVVATRLGSGVRIAPRLAEQRDAWACCKQKDDGQGGCSQHHYARLNLSKIAATPVRSLISAEISALDTWQRRHRRDPGAFPRTGAEKPALSLAGIWVHPFADQVAAFLP